MLWTRCVYRRPYRARTYVRAPSHGHRQQQQQQTDRQADAMEMHVAESVRSAVWSAVEMCILKNRIQRWAIADCVACRYVRMQRDGKYAWPLLGISHIVLRMGKFRNRVKTVFRFSAAFAIFPFTHAVIVWCTAADRKEMNANDKLICFFFLSDLGIRRGWREKSLTKNEQYSTVRAVVRPKRLSCRESNNFIDSRSEYNANMSSKIQISKRHTNGRSSDWWTIMFMRHAAYFANLKCKQKSGATRSQLEKLTSVWNDHCGPSCICQPAYLLSWMLIY